MQEGDQLINSFEETSKVIMDSIRDVIWKVVWERLNGQINFEVKINAVNGIIQDVIINDSTSE